MRPKEAGGASRRKVDVVQHPAEIAVPLIGRQPARRWWRVGRKQLELGRKLAGAGGSTLTTKIRFFGF